MPYSFSAIWPAIETLISSTWTDITRCISTTEMNFVNLRKFINNGQLVPPFALVHISPYDPDDKYGVSNETYQIEVSIAYVRVRDMTNAQVTADTLVRDLVETQAKALADAIYAYTSGAFQVVIDPVIDASEKNKVNRMLQPFEWNLYAGMCTFTIIVGST